MQKRYLFVSAPFSGIEVFFRNLRLKFQNTEGITASWVFIEWNSKDPGVLLPLVRSNWTLKGGLIARRRIHELEKAGSVFDAALFNHISAASLTGSFRRHTPMLLSIDVTPILLDQFSHWYKRGGRALPHIGRRLKTAMLDRRIYQDARRILAWSSLTRKSLIEEYGVLPDRVVVVPPGVDVNYWRGEPSPDESRRQSADGARILFVGGDFERKGGDTVISLARRREFKNCEFLLVTKADIPSAPANVKLFSSIAPNSRQLVELYRSADIFFMPTRADFSPNALCEAMAAGLPVVSSSIGAIPEIVQHGKTGFLNEPGDLEGFAGSLLTLLRDPGCRTRMGSAGQRVAEEQFNLDKTAAAVLYHMATAAAAR